jgi:predicted RNase H-like HicB family nuclease
MSEYLVVLDWADGNWSGYCPDVNGCIATGATPEECERNIAEALAFHFEGLREDGLPVPPPRARAAQVRIAA